MSRLSVAAAKTGSEPPRNDMRRIVSERLEKNAGD